MDNNGKWDTMSYPGRYRNFRKHVHMGLDFCSYLFIFTALRRSVACSNLVGGGIPTLISDHRTVRICHYRIFIN